MDPRNRGPDSLAACEKRWGSRVPILPLISGVTGSGEKRVGGSGWEAPGGPYVFVLVCIPPGWRSCIHTGGGYSGGESSWILGYQEGDHWPEMAPVV